MSDLIQVQKDREDQQLSLGIERYYAEIETRGVGNVTAGMGLVEVAMGPIIAWIEDNVRKLESGETHPSSVPLGIHWLAEMSADAVAWITAKLCLSASYNEANVTRTSMKIANLIEEHYRYEELEQNEPALANSMAARAKRWPSTRVRRKIMRKAADIAGVRRMTWTEDEKSKLGFKLIEAYVTQTGFAELRTMADREKGTKMQQKIMVMTSACRARLDERNSQMEGDSPINRPMVCTPQPWTTPLKGGYLTDLMKRPILRGAKFRKITEGLLDELFSSDMQPVYDAVNAVQSVEWRINRWVYDVMRECLASPEGPNRNLLPTSTELPLPPLPASLPPRVKGEKQTLSEEQLAALHAWKVEAREVHGVNAANKSQLTALQSKLTQAQEVLDFDTIWFPHSLDFRGRIYPLTAELSPQSDDTSKALLEFSKGKPLGETGGFWLCVQIANLFGEDKMSFEDRVAWTMMRKDMLIDSGTSPLDGHRFWTEAEEPWGALAACREFAGWMSEGDSYVSHLPVAMDGSCSGIQHFSAMLRDQRGAAAVNLTKTDTPSDIYMEVLEATKELLKASKEPLAKVWMDKVDRKIVKRPCMTFAYSVTSAGIRNQITDEIRKRQQGDFLPGTPNWQAAMFLAPFVESAIRDVVERAAEAMDWLKGISKMVSKEDVPTGWTTPLGFKVLQPYIKSKSKRMKVLFDGVPLFYTLSFEGNKIDGLKQASAVAPNYVHSMDATHLMMTVNRLVSEGITDSFAVIHDSFGVHACDVDELHYALRDEFVKLYSESEVLVDFYRESLLRLPGDKWPEADTPPEAGEYNLEEVRDADFFFA